MTLNDAILLAGERLRDRVEVKRDLDFDHEFTLQFHLAWEVTRTAREIRWQWLCDGSGGDISLARGMRHFWLTPIFVEMGDSIAWG